MHTASSAALASPGEPKASEPVVAAATEEADDPSVRHL